MHYVLHKDIYTHTHVNNTAVVVISYKVGKKQLRYFRVFFFNISNDHRVFKGLLLCHQERSYKGN